MPMTMHEASRTLVKSTPELWAECSHAASLSRHLGAFGEIRITKLEPETAVAWEGDDVRGTVTLEQSGWGTRVVLTATAEGSEMPVAPAAEFVEEPGAETAAEPEPAPEPQPAAEGTPRPGFFARLFGFRRRSRPGPRPLGDEDPLIGLTDGGEETRAQARAAEAQPVAEAQPPAEVISTAEPDRAPPRALELDVLVEALDSLGTAHRRPFSRS
jgi:hypothetical protein